MTDLEFVRTADRAATLLRPMRRLVLEHLEEPDSAAGLARRLNISRQRLNYHLRELEKQGLVACVEERRRGNCTERILRATARAFVITPEALGVLGESAEADVDRFSTAYLASAATRTLRDMAVLSRRAGGRGVATLTLETEIRFASTASRAEFADDLADALARLAAKYHDESAPAGRRFRLVTMAHPSATPGRERLSEARPDPPGIGTAGKHA